MTPTTLVPCEFCERYFDPTDPEASHGPEAYVCPECCVPRDDESLLSQAKRSVRACIAKQRVVELERPKSTGASKWDKRFLDMAALIATWSKDRSTKCGAVVVDDVRNVRAVGYNGFPRGIDDDLNERHERPLKYYLVAHAEQNAIFAAARHGASLEGCTLYCNRSSCSECAKAIIQAGIKRVVYPLGADGPTGGLNETFKVAGELLREAGVEVSVVKSLLEEALGECDDCNN